jgi:hypothetical protein
MTKHQEHCHQSFLNWQKTVTENQTTITVSQNSKSLPNDKLTQTLILMSNNANSVVNANKLKSVLNKDDFDIVCLSHEYYENMNKFTMYGNVIALAKDVTGGEFVETAKENNFTLLSAETFKPLLALKAA